MNEVCYYYGSNQPFYPQWCWYWNRQFTEYVVHQYGDPNPIPLVSPDCSKCEFYITEEEVEMADTFMV